jgi:MinD-like ATPase involved in chromosome partitioning or flagellar assembly
MSITHSEEKVSHTVLVTVVGPEESIDLELPGDVPVVDLIPAFVELFALESHSSDPYVWALGPSEGPPFPKENTLLQCGVVDGDQIFLQTREAWNRNLSAHAKVSDEQALSSAPGASSDNDASQNDDRLSSNEWKPRGRTRAILPEAIPWQKRVEAVLRAVFSHETPTLESSSSETSPTSGHLLSPSSLAIQKAPGWWKRARKTWRKTNYLNQLDERIAEPQLQRCATIAVVSPKGGVGKTTITALLGTLLAFVRRDRIVAIDTNPDFGSLGRILAPDHQIFVDDLLYLLDNTPLTVTRLDGNLGRAVHGLMVLPAPTDPVRMATLDEAAYTRVVRRLQEMVGVVVLDCGTGLQDPASKAALATADQIVLVTDAQPSSASLVTEAAALLQQEGTPIWMVVNKMSAKGIRLDLQALEHAIPHARGFIEIPAESQAADQLSAGIFDWHDAPSSWKRVVRELAVSLIAEWPVLGISK